MHSFGSEKPTDLKAPRYPAASMRAATYLVELLVGLACLAGVMPLWRRGGRARVAGAFLAVAGVAAVAHAALRLVP